MAVAVRPEVAAAPRDEVRLHPGSFHPEDAMLLVAAIVSSGFISWLVYGWLTPLSGPVGFFVWWYLAFLATYWLGVRRLHGKLIARDSLMTVLITSGSLSMLVPLGLIIGFILYQGIRTLTPTLLTETVQFCGQLNGANCGGVGHAIVGTLEQVGLALIMSVPLAVLTAIFLNEVGGPWKRPVRLFVDAMSGIPSIVAGLFIYAVWNVGLGRGFSGFAASLALAILMLPTIARTSEEVLRLVPDGLREGALALGASEWRTVWAVVLPTARSGLITAVILGVARGVGETAPLIMTSFGNSQFNFNPFSGAQEALPHFVFQYIFFNPGTAPKERAWSAAAVLTILVLVLFTAARAVGARTSIESRQRRASRKAARLAQRALRERGATT